MNTSLTKAAIREEMKDFLGDGIVDVELQDRHIVKAIKDAVRAFNRYRAPRAWAAIQGAIPTVKKYAMASVHPRMAGIVSVSHIDNLQIGSAGSYLDPFQYQKVTTLLGGETFGQIHSDLVYMRMSREVASAEFEWTAQWEASAAGGPDAYFLYMDLRRPMDIAIEFTWYLTEQPAPDANAGESPASTDFTYGLQSVPEGDTAWFINYITARCKQTLGRALRKFGGVPSPDGGTTPNDGAELVQEGRVDEEKCLEEIKRKRRPLPFIRG